MKMCLKQCVFKLEKICQKLDKLFPKLVKVCSKHDKLGKVCPKLCIKHLSAMTPLFGQFWQIC